jgi:hypothetical protein
MTGAPVILAVEVVAQRTGADRWCSTGRSVSSGNVPPGLRLPYGITTSTTVRDAMRTIPGATAQWGDVFQMYSITTRVNPR